MYVPKHFALTGLDAQHALIDACDFGIVTSAGPDGLLATHIPLMLKRGEGKLGTLYGHVARDNPHVKLFGAKEALMVFSGPHAYISPSWYADRSLNVPTWNYTAVHCYGLPTLTHGDPIAHLREMVERYEAGRRDAWRIDELNAGLRERLPQGIVTFRMEITRIEGKVKLSQNKPRAERERLIAGLESAGETRLSQLMRKELEKA